MCSFRFDKASKLFIFGFNEEKLLEINALRRLGMPFQRPYNSKSSGEACPRRPPPNPLSSSRRDCPPPPPNKSNLSTAAATALKIDYLSKLLQSSILNVFYLGDALLWRKGQRIDPLLNASACILLLLIREIPPEFNHGGKLVLRSENYLLGFEIIPRVLNEAKQITTRLSKGYSVEKI